MVSRWLGPGNRTFLEVASMVVTWWIVAFLPSEPTLMNCYPETLCHAPGVNVSVTVSVGDIFVL